MSQTKGSSLSLSVLHLEDDLNDAELIQVMLAAKGITCRMIRVETRAQFQMALEKGGFDLILTDYTLPSFDGLSALAMAREQCPQVPFIFVSGTIGEDRAIEALHRGATDYVLKQKLSRLVPAVRRALREAEDHLKRRQAEEMIYRVHAELEIARKIQQSLLPQAPLALAGVTLAGYCLPADQIGGDYFDYFLGTKDCVDIAIGDVSGHGVGAALLMAEARSALRAQVLTFNGPMEVLQALNELLYEDLERAERFITLLYAKYHCPSRKLYLASAGHNPPLLFRPGETSCTKLSTNGLFLGIQRKVLFEEKYIFLNPGDTVIFYTDGITEAENEQEELFGQQRLSNILIAKHTEMPTQIIEAVLKEVNGFRQGKPLADDVTLVAMKVT